MTGEAMTGKAAYSAHDVLLMNYAAGRLCPHDALIVAAHVALNAAARRRVAEFEALGGQLMCSGKPAEVTRECLSRILDRIGQTPEKIPAPAPCDEKKAADLHIPAVVYTLITSFCAQDDYGWAQISRGVTKIDLKPECARSNARKRLRLMRLAPHEATPAHAHTGRELTLVLEGGFSDDDGHYSRGDIIIIDDPALVHQPTATSEGCVCLSVTEAPLRFVDPLYRLLNAFLRS
jgi:putative transcriptional regulator